MSTLCFNSKHSHPTRSILALSCSRGCLSSTYHRRRYNSPANSQSSTPPPPPHSIEPNTPQPAGIPQDPRYRSENLRSSPDAAIAGENCVRSQTHHTIDIRNGSVAFCFLPLSNLNLPSSWSRCKVWRPLPHLVSRLVGRYAVVGGGGGVVYSTLLYSTCAEAPAAAVCNG